MSTAAGNITIFHSPDLEPLLEHAAVHLSSPLSDPFAREIIVVPHSDMVRYLKRNLSRHLGASSKNREDGIVANVEFVYPRQLANASTTDLLGLSPSPWDAHRLTWSIAHVVPTSHLAVPGFNRAPLSVARRAADLFDRYASHRPEMLKHWRNKDSVLAGDQLSWLHKDGSQNWQQLLFAAVAEFVDSSTAAVRASHNVNAFRDAVEQAAQVGQLPARITIFGINALSRSSRIVLHALSAHCAVTVYLVYAPHSHLPTLPEEGILVRPDSGIGSLSHPLYRRWGVQAIEGAAGVATLGHLEPLAPRDRTESLLHRVQHDIITDTEHASSPNAQKPSATSIKGDGTIQIHACYGLTRQAEAVRDALLHLFNADSSLRLRDVAILCADVDASAPVLNAVLNSPTADSQTFPSMNIDVLGTTAQLADSLSEAFFAILRLAVSRCSPSEILDVASLPAISRHFGFTDTDIDLLSTWAEQLAVKYGLDGEHRQDISTIPETITNGTWQAALERLFIGVSVPAEVDRVGPGGVVPYDGISSNEIDTAGLVAEFLFRLKNLILATSHTDGMTIEEWRDVVMTIVDEFISVAPADTEKFVRLKSTLAAIGEDALATHVALHQRYPVADLMSLTSEYFNDAFSVFGSKSEAITVASTSSLQHVPYRVIVLFGADEAAFAGSHSDGDDVLSNTPCVGEPIYSLTGRQTLLNALMAARDAFIITCTGADVSNNKPVPLAVPLEELIQVVSTTISTYGINGHHCLLAEHPRQNFDVRTLSTGTMIDGVPFTFDPRALTALHTLQNRSTTGATQSSTTSTKGAIRPVRDLSQLVRAITNPSEFFVQNILNISLPRVAGSSSTKESAIVGDAVMNLTTDRLQESLEGRELLDRVVRHAQSDGSFANTINNWRTLRPKTGVLPPHKLGELVVNDITSEVETMVSQLPEELRNFPRGTFIDCVVQSPTGPATLRVPSVIAHEESDELTVVRARFKRFSESAQLELWLEIAALTIHTNGAPVVGYLVTRAAESKKPPVCRELRITGSDNAERLAHAQSALNCAFIISAAATQGPLPLFEYASFQLAKHNVRGASTAFENDLQRSSAVRFLYDDTSFEDIVQLPLTAEDRALLQPLRTSHSSRRAQAYADVLWSTFVDTIVSDNDNNGDGETEDSSEGDDA